MIELLIKLTCDDCGEILTTGQQFTSTDLARAYAVEQGWQLVSVHRVDLDFCPDCQVGAAVATGVGV